MKAYLITTGTIFGLLVLMHVWRITVEPNLVRDPWYWAITALAGALSVWAWWLVLSLRKSFH